MFCQAQITRGCAQNDIKTTRANTRSPPTQRKKGQFSITTKFYIQRSGKEKRKKEKEKTIKQGSHQWYLKFNDTIISFGFKKNTVDRCIYLKVNGSKVIFLILYVDDILLATNNLGLLHETKKFLSSNFEMKDMGETSYVIGIEIF